MKKIIFAPLLLTMAVSLLTGCSIQDDPAAVVTSKPDAARSAALDSSLQSVVSEVEGSRDANGLITAKTISSVGNSVVIKPLAGGKDYCLNLKDNTSGQSKTYTSTTGKSIDGGSCSSS